MPSQAERIAKRDDLYWTYRYRKGSYKARKMNLQPILITARRDGDKIRVYGYPDEVIAPKKLQFAKARFKTWRQKERELRRLAKSGLRNSGKRSATVPVGLAG